MSAIMSLNKFFRESLNDFVESIPSLKNVLREFVAPSLNLSHEPSITVAADSVTFDRSSYSTPISEATAAASLPDFIIPSVRARSNSICLKVAAVDSALTFFIASANAVTVLTGVLSANPLPAASNRSIAFAVFSVSSARIFVSVLSFVAALADLTSASSCRPKLLLTLITANLASTNATLASLTFFL